MAAKFVWCSSIIFTGTGIIYRTLAQERLLESCFLGLLRFLKSLWFSLLRSILLVKLVRPRQWEEFLGKSLKQWVHWNMRANLGWDIEGQKWAAVFVT